MPFFFPNPFKSFFCFNIFSVGNLSSQEQSRVSRWWAQKDFLDFHRGLSCLGFFPWNIGRRPRQNLRIMELEVLSSKHCEDLKPPVLDTLYQTKTVERLHFWRIVCTSCDIMYIHILYIYDVYYISLWNQPYIQHLRLYASLSSASIICHHIIISQFLPLRRSMRSWEPFANCGVCRGCSLQWHSRAWSLPALDIFASWNCTSSEDSTW